MLTRVTNFALAAALLMLVWGAAIPPAQGQAEKRPKDQKEYELINGVFKETDAAKKLQMLQEWEKSYPETAYSTERVQSFMQAHQQAGNAKETVEWAKKVLELIPGDIQANLAITATTAVLYPGASDSEKPQILEDGATAAGALFNLQKPAGVADAQWAAATKQIGETAHETLGWIAMQRKAHATAEKEFLAVLESNPTKAQVSYWLGTEVLAQSNPEKNELALYSIARAAAYEGEGALPAAGRTQVDEYLKTVYMTYAGTEDGLEDLKVMAKNSPLPPADLEIKPAAVRRYEEEQKSRQENPLLWAFLDLKKTLQGPSGDSVWGDLRGKLTPRMRLYVVSAPARSRTISLSSTPGGPVEVEVGLSNMMRQGVGSGRQLTFDGVASNLTKDPFKLTLTDGAVPALGISR